MKRREDIDHLLSYPFLCPNCESIIREGKLFCKELCKEEAKYIRYYRACISSGRISQPDVREALRIRIAHILGGGYPAQLREISKELRQLVISKYKGLCKVCGKSANQIDHIKGNSNELKNLQLLCAKCHNEKTIKNFVPITAETHPLEWIKYNELLIRATARKPIKPCDSSRWENEWRYILTSRRQILKNRKIASQRRKELIPHSR